MHPGCVDIARRSRLAIAAWLCAAVLPFAHAADTAYPARPIRVIVPQAPGGTTDLVARVIGERLEAALGVAVVIDDRPGANGVIGTDLARRAAPDGHTLLAATTATHAMAPHATADVAFDALRDFVPVVNLVYQTKVLLVSNALDVGTVQELAALARKRPRELNYASTGPGSSSHLDTEQLARTLAIELTHIPYRGSPQTVAALAVDEVQVLLASVTAAQAAIAAGRVRPLAVLSDRRSPLLPNVPTLAEAGVPRLDAKTWIGLLAPAGTPRAVVERLNASANRILQESAVREWLDKQGLEPAGGTAAAFAAELRADYDKWGDAARRLGIRPR